MYLVPIKRRMWDLFVFIWLFDWLDGCLGLDPRIEAFLIFSICLLCMDLGVFFFLILIFFISLHFISPCQYDIGGGGRVYLGRTML